MTFRRHLCVVPFEVVGLTACFRAERPKWQRLFGKTASAEAAVVPSSSYRRSKSRSISAFPPLYSGRVFTVALPWCSTIHPLTAATVCATIMRRSAAAA